MKISSGQFIAMCGDVQGQPRKPRICRPGNFWPVSPRTECPFAQGLPVESVCRPPNAIGRGRWPIAYKRKRSRYENMGGFPFQVEQGAGCFNDGNAHGSVPAYAQDDQQPAPARERRCAGIRARYSRSSHRAMRSIWSTGSRILISGQRSGSARWVRHAERHCQWRAVAEQIGKRRDQLRRIPATDVVRIEILDGNATSIPGLPDRWPMWSTPATARPGSSMDHRLPPAQHRPSFWGRDLGHRQQRGARLHALRTRTTASVRMGRWHHRSRRY